MSASTSAPGRQRILRAAAQLFAEEGYPAVTMRAIAARVAMTPAGLYAHYPSKAAILADFVEADVKRFVRSVEAACEREVGPVARLRRFAVGHVLESLASAELGPFNIQIALQQLARHLEPEARTSLVEFQRAHLRYLQAILRHGVATGDFRAGAAATPTAEALLTMCDFITNWYRPSGPLSAPQLAEHHADLVLRMVSAGGASPSPPPPR